MKGNLGATTNEIGWVVTAYAIGNVIIIPMTSWLAQQFGRRNYFAASIVIFTIFSFLCGNATTIEELIIFRFVQGVGGGALLVTSQTIITESYPVEKRSMKPKQLIKIQVGKNVYITGNKFFVSGKEVLCFQQASTGLKKVLSFITD